MKLRLFVLLVLFANAMTAQFVLEHTYDSASLYNSCQGKQNQLMLVKFETLGECYVKVNRCGSSIKIYNINHSLIKTISLANVPIPAPPYDSPQDVLYISEKLFNTDSKIEFMYVNVNSTYTTIVYNENGTVLFSDAGAPLVRPNYHLQQFPIYNTSQGTKMVLSYKNGDAKVFGLSGTLSLSVKQLNETLMEQSMLSNARPNPSVNGTQISYALPEGNHEGIIVFYDVQGREVKRFEVDDSFDHISLNKNDLSSGTYIYQLQFDGKKSGSKKMIVIE